MNDTPNPAELRAAKSANDAGLNSLVDDKGNTSAMLTAEALAIRSSLHLDEVREAIVSAQQKLGGYCFFYFERPEKPTCIERVQRVDFCPYCKLEQALEHLSE